MADYTSDLYVASGYVNETYISDSYVAEGYVTGVVSGLASVSASATLTSAGSVTRSATASISSSATVTADAKELDLGSTLFVNSGTLTAKGNADFLASATLEVNAHDGVTFSDYGSWDHDPQQIWGPTLNIPDSGVKLFIEGGAVTLSSSATLSADGDKTQRASITGAMAATLSASGSKIHSTATADLQAFNTVLSAGSLINRCRC